LEVRLFVVVFVLGEDLLSRRVPALPHPSILTHPTQTSTKKQGLRGLAATAPIADGETIVTLPVSAALLVRPKSRCPLPPAWCGQEAWRAAPWYLKMGLLILEAAARPPPSASAAAAAGAVDGAAAYVAGLPPVRGGLDTPALGWTDEEVAALACPPLAKDVSLFLLFFLLAARREEEGHAGVYALAGCDHLPCTGTMERRTRGRARNGRLLTLPTFHSQNHQIAAQRASWNAAFDAYAASHPDSPLLNPAAVPAWAADGVSPRDRFLWALACVRSRAFSGPYAGPPLRARASLAAALTLAGAASIAVAHAPPDRVLTGAIAAVLFNILYDLGLSARVRWHAMAPLVDMANHDGRAASTMEYGYFDDAFQLAVQGKGHAPGEQVFISYGPQGNDGLVQYYGFAEARNPHDAARVDVVREGSATEPLLRAVFTAAGPDPATVDAATEVGLGGGPPGVATPALHRALGAAAAGEADRVRSWQQQQQPAGSGSAPLHPGRAALAATFRAERAATLTAAAAACERAAKRLEAGRR
jgi:hypothetical protein